MTEDTPTSSQEPLHSELEWLVAEWTDALAQAVAATGAERPAVERADSRGPHHEAGSFWWAQKISLMAGHAVCVGASESAWKALGGAAMSAGGPEVPEPLDVREKYQEILAQSLAGLARSLSARLKAEVTCEQGESLAAPPEGEHYAFVNVRTGEVPPAQLCLIASPALLEQLGAATPADTQAAGHGPSEEQTPASLRSLSDLEMPISISFGKVSVPLQEALELRSGSLVPLNRAPDDPVELRVNDRVVARGQIVMIEGNYAIRIIELLSRAERLRHAGSVQRGGASLHPVTH